MDVQQTGVDTRTATRDLKALSDLGLLRPIGETRGRHYVSGPHLNEVRVATGGRRGLSTPYPEMVAELAVRAAEAGRPSDRLD